MDCFFQPQIWPQCETNRFSTKRLHYSMCPCTVASLVTEHSCLMFRKRPENGKGGCVCRGWCVRFPRVFFTSYSQTPSVPAKGLSHSYWPRCHPAFAPLPDIQREQWTKVAGEKGGWIWIEFRAKSPHLMWKDISIYFQKTFSTVLTNIKWHCCHTTANSKCCCCYLFRPNTVFHIAVGCQQLANFRVSLSSDLV